MLHQTQVSNFGWRLFCCVRRCQLVFCRVVWYTQLDGPEFDEERDCMGKAILAMIVTVIVGYISGVIFANWVNAPEWGVILAVAVMGAFIIYFNDKKQ